MATSMPHPRLRRLALVPLFAGCLGFDYQVTIEPTIDPASVAADVGTVAGGFNQPGGSPSCFENGRIFMSDTGNHVIKSVDRESGALDTVAGKSGVKGLVDGRGGAAAFYNPHGVVVGPDDNCALPSHVTLRSWHTGTHTRPHARRHCRLLTPWTTHVPCAHHAHCHLACPMRVHSHVWVAVYIADMMNHAIRRMTAWSKCPCP